MRRPQGGRDAEPTAARRDARIPDARLDAAYVEGREVWRLPGPGPAVLPRSPTVFGDATIVNQGLDAVEARRFSDGVRLWRQPREAGDSWSRSLTVGGAYLYGVDDTGVTAIDRRTGTGNTIRMCCGEVTDDAAIRGYSDVLLAADRYALTVFDLPR
ncbi:MAG TPA: hypothetical protein VH912_31820 [Streptosporangiaceae bacterium]